MQTELKSFDFTIYKSKAISFKGLVNCLTPSESNPQPQFGVRDQDELRSFHVQITVYMNGELKEYTCRLGITKEEVRDQLCQLLWMFEAFGYYDISSNSGVRNSLLQNVYDTLNIKRKEELESAEEITTNP